MTGNHGSRGLLGTSGESQDELGSETEKSEVLHSRANQSRLLCWLISALTSDGSVSIRSEDTLQTHSSFGAAKQITLCHHTPHLQMPNCSLSKMPLKPCYTLACFGSGALSLPHIDMVNFLSTSSCVSFPFKPGQYAAPLSTFMMEPRS